MNSPSPSSAAARPTPTRSQLLDAAERLFAEMGAHRTSVRSITARAGANVAAVSYYFGSKEGLVREVLTRRLEPLNQRRLELLESARTTDTGRARIEAIVLAFVAPALDMVRREPGGGEFARFLARSLSEPDDRIRALILDEFAPVIDAFTTALSTALPTLDPTEVHWRFTFMVGSLIHTLGLGFLLHFTSDGRCDPHDVDELVAQLVAFVTAGFQAPSAAETAP